MHKSPKFFLYSLILVQLILTTGLGIFGNKISELVDISTVLLFTLTTFFIILLFFVGILLFQHEESEIGRGFSLNNFMGVFNQLVLDRIITIFPFALIAGILTGFLLTFIFPGSSVLEILAFPSIIKRSAWIWNDYDAVGYIVAVATAFVISLYKNKFVVTFVYGLGFATGFTSIVLLFRPDQNTFWGTLAGWTLIVLTVLLIRSQTAKGFAIDIRNLFQYIIAER